jgi:hypothetical protein
VRRLPSQRQPPLTSIKLNPNTTAVVVEVRTKTEGLSHISFRPATGKVFRIKSYIYISKDNQIAVRELLISCCKVQPSDYLADHSRGAPTLDRHSGQIDKMLLLLVPDFDRDQMPDQSLAEPLESRSPQ